MGIGEHATFTVLVSQVQIESIDYIFIVSHILIPDLTMASTLVSTSRASSAVGKCIVSFCCKKSSFKGTVPWNERTCQMTSVYPSEKNFADL